LANLNSPSATTGVSFDSKSHTTHLFSVPIAIQWHFGLKATQVTGDGAS